jgi:hypothetical protein
MLARNHPAVDEDGLQTLVAAMDHWIQHLHSATRLLFTYIQVILMISDTYGCKHLTWSLGATLATIV